MISILSVFCTNIIIHRACLCRSAINCMHAVSESLTSLKWPGYIYIPSGRRAWSVGGGGVGGGGWCSLHNACLTDNQGIITFVFTTLFSVLFQLSSLACISGCIAYVVCKESNDVQPGHFAVFLPFHPGMAVFQAFLPSNDWSRQYTYLESSAQAAAYVKLQLHRDLGRWRSCVFPAQKWFCWKTFAIVALTHF